MKILYTKELGWLEKWDAFILNDDKGSHLLLSDWVQSFRSYGFDYEFCICLENDEIVGGYGAVVAKALFFNFYIVPYGPVASAGHAEFLNGIIADVPRRAAHYNSCYCHITLPLCPFPNAHTFLRLPELQALQDARQGHLFKYVYSANGLNWIDLKGHNEDSLLNSFKSSVRRDIRSSLRKGLTIKFLETETELKAGYDLCVENASKNNYSIRDWSSFRETLIDMTLSKTSRFLAAYQDDKLKGAILLVKSGNFLTYILGGTIKEKPDLLTGHLLQWEAIKLSLNENHDGYNISLGGSAGVVDFKSSFNTQQLLFENSKYHWVLKPVFFKMYLIAEKYLKPYKTPISKILAFLKNALS